MMSRNPIAAALTHTDTLILDGALATELEARGCNLADTLWSAKVLMENPELIYQVHYDYFAAGANVAITASYQATPLGFAARGLDSGQASALIRRAWRWPSARATITVLLLAARHRCWWPDRSVLTALIWPTAPSIAATTACRLLK